MNKTTGKHQQNLDSPLRLSYAAIASAIISVSFAFTVLPMAFPFGLLAILLASQSLYKKQDKILSTISIVVAAWPTVIGVISIILYVGLASYSGQTGTNLPSYTTKQEIDKAAEAVRSYKIENGGSVPSTEEFYSNEFRKKYHISTNSAFDYFPYGGCSPGEQLTDSASEGVKTEATKGIFSVQGNIAYSEMYCANN